MTQSSDSAKLNAKGNEILAPIWNAVREFVEMGQAGSVTLHFDKSGKLREIESKKKTTI